MTYCNECAPQLIAVLKQSYNEHCSVKGNRVPIEGGLCASCVLSDIDAYFDQHLPCCVELCTAAELQRRKDDYMMALQKKEEVGYGVRAGCNRTHCPKPNPNCMTLCFRNYIRNPSEKLIVLS